jgi:hypothetical protein
MPQQEKRLAGNGPGQGSPSTRAGCPRFDLASPSKALLRRRPQGLAPPHPRPTPVHSWRARTGPARPTATIGACPPADRRGRPETPADHPGRSNRPSHRPDRPDHLHAGGAAGAPPTTGRGFDRRPNGEWCGCRRRGTQPPPCDSAGSYGATRESHPGRSARPGDDVPFCVWLALC